MKANYCPLCDRKVADYEPTKVIHNGEVWHKDCFASHEQRTDLLVTQLALRYPNTGKFVQ